MFMFALVIIKSNSGKFKWLDMKLNISQLLVRLKAEPFSIKELVTLENSFSKAVKEAQWPQSFWIVSFPKSSFS